MEIVEARPIVQQPIAEFLRARGGDIVKIDLSKFAWYVWLCFQPRIKFSLWNIAYLTVCVWFSRCRLFSYIPWTFAWREWNI